MDRNRNRPVMSTKKKMPRKCENAQLPTNISDIQDSGKNLRNRCHAKPTSPRMAGADNRVIGDCEDTAAVGELSLGFDPACAGFCRGKGYIGTKGRFSF